MTPPPLVIIAAGGTGGHMFPAQALAEVLLGRGWNVRLSTDARGARYVGGFPDAVEIEKVSSATFARGSFAAKAAAPFRIAGGIAASVLRLRRAGPRVVVGFGGYPSVPAMAAAAILKLPRMLHEQTGVLGRANGHFAKRVQVVACGTWPTDLPQGVEGVPVGNPVRAAVLARAGAPYVPPGDRPMSLLVIGGSQGARILSDIVPAAVDALPEPLRGRLRVAHQAREEDRAGVAEFYAARDIDAEVSPFFDDIPRRMSEAQLVISRSGASSVADISVIGRPSILVPFAAAAGDHQSANARALAEAEAAVVISERNLSVAALGATIEAILGQPEAAARMARNALSVSRPNAAEDLADLAETLAGLDNKNMEGAGEP